MTLAGRMASVRIPVRHLKNPDIKLGDYACQIRQKLPTALTHRPGYRRANAEQPQVDHHLAA